jgi:FixJ family two-component response regulator
VTGRLPSIAIVDDDAPVLKALGRLLRGRGYETAAYGSAREFLAALPQSRPDCLILDLQMPGMGGLELLQDLKRRAVALPTIVITARGDDELADRCLSCGAVAFLSKPLQSATLFAALREAAGEGSRPTA